LNDVVIRAEALGKKYVIGHESGRQSYTALRDVIGRTAKNVLRATSDMLRGRAMVAGDTTEEFWALRDVNFEIRRGEVVGIIGRNGAGKSTLLKILSRITEPTDGRVEIRGRVASLLEVGTGFHPELTGRENIYLNGAILGMTRAEIRRKFDEIVAFAEVEKFLDTPVKRYSSGMYVRLAFAVAAHLEPEILVVDEVLAVGDAEFQKKCLGKMSEVAGGGRTVLFVSHNVSAIRALCEKGIVLDKGRVQISGAISAALAKYNIQSNVTDAFFRAPRYSARPSLVSVSIVRPDHNEHQSVVIEVVVAASEQTATSIDIRLKDGFLASVGFGSLGAFSSDCPVLISPGLTRIFLKMATAQLANGDYLISVDLTRPHVEFFDRAEDCVRFKIEASSRVEQSRNLEQNWGYGCFVIPLQVMATPDYDTFTKEAKTA
jgi:lipopolysaccharide transport system ATP-binding protein